MPDGASVHEREALLELLDAAARRVAATGLAAAASVCGEPGIGKSTLLDLAVGRLGAGWSVLRVTGRALGSDRPFDASRAFVRRMCHLLGAPTLDATAADALEGVAVLLTRLAARGPVAIVVDDLHWVDAASIDLLDYLWTEFAVAPVLWLVAFRRPEAEGRSAVRHLVHRVERDRRTTPIDVPRLSLAAVTSICVAAHGAGELPAGLADHVFARSCGNPLVVDALLRAPAAAGPAGFGSAPIAGYVREVFAGRITDLPPAERDALCLAAALDAPVVEREAMRVLVSLGHSRVAARGAVRALVSAGLLERRAPDSVAAGHPVVGEVALDVYAGEELGRVCAAILVAQRGSLGAFEAARLAEAAGDALPPDLAVDVLTAGADQVVGSAAVDIAVRWQHEAVRQAGRLEPPNRAAASARALLRLVAHLDGTPSEALTVADGAMLAAGETDDAILRVDAALALARSRWRAAGTGAIEEDLVRLVELGDQGGPDLGLRACVSGLRLAVVAGLDDDRLQRLAAECARRAAAAGRPGAAAGVDLLLGIRRMHRFGPQDWLRLAQVLADRDAELPAHLVEVLQAEQAQLLGDLAGLERWAASPSLPAWRRLLARFEVAFVTGRWDDAQRAVDSMGSLGTHAEARDLRGWLAVHRGIPVPEDPRADDALGVRRLVVAYGALIGGEGPPPDVSWPDEYLAMQEGRLRPVIAELQLAAGRDDDVQRTLARIDAMAVTGGRMQAAAERLRGLQARARGELSAARALLEAAAASNARCGLVVDAALCELDALSLGPASELDEVSLQRLGDLASWFEDIGAAPWATRARRRIAAPPSARPRQGGPALTRREMEIARLVADGRSNAQIAAELYLSVRTVTSHLDHAYTKLGIGSRAALAVYVREIDRNT